MIPALAMGALSAGGALLSSFGAQQAAAKQARMQEVADEKAAVANWETLDVVNRARREMATAMLSVPEETTTVNSSWVDTDAMMAAAERSGFNPVTWLNAGGMAAYTQGSTYKHTIGHNAAEAYKLMVPEYYLRNASQVPQQHSALSAFGGALSAGASAFGTQYRADQSFDLQSQRLASMAMGSVNQGMGLSQTNGLVTALLNSGSPGNVGGVGGSGAVGGLSGGKKDEDVYWPGYEQPSPQLWENKKPESTNPFPPSWGWTIPAGYANAETWEDTFGEPVSWPYGAWKFANTAAYNIMGNTISGGLSNASSVTPGGPISNWLRSGGASGFSGSVTPYAPFAGAYPDWARP